MVRRTEEEGEEEQEEEEMISRGFSLTRKFDCKLLTKLHYITMSERYIYRYEY